jgi:hypothetical protein
VRYVGRILTGLYALVVLVALLHAVTTEIRLQHQEIDHLLPSLVLAFVTLPLSLAIEPLYSMAPSWVDGPFVQLALLALCGALQASTLWWLVSPQRARSAR